MTWDSELERAKTAARAAGTLLRGALAGDREVGRDMKAQAVRDAGAVILQELSVSDYPVLAREREEHDVTASDGPIWVVEPLDGTLNFERGIPVCCVSIGLFQGDEAILGVIHDFNHDDVYEAVSWQGAYLNGEPMCVSGIADRSCAIATSGTPDAARGAQRFKEVRNMGSAAMSLAYVACGCVEAYIDDNIMLWNVAAGVALVREAGGCVELGHSDKNRWARSIRAYASEGLSEEPM